jgi:hypothetical protein
VLGRAAYEGGLPAAALGLALHFGIATGVATTFYLASLKMPLLLRRPVLCGLLFGLSVWAFMYNVVLPVTFGRPYAVPALPQLINQLGIHMLGVGLPIAIFAARSSSNHETTQRRGTGNHRTVINYEQATTKKNQG